MNLPPPLTIYRVPGRREAVVVLAFTALPQERINGIIKLGEGYPGGGLESPAFKVDYLCDLRATKGFRIIPDFSEAVNVQPFDVPRVSRYVLSFDFGGTSISRTAILGAYQTPKQVRVFLEFVPKPIPTRLVKERLRDMVRGVMPWMRNPDMMDFEWVDHFDCIGDCTGVGYKLDYNDVPYQLSIQNPSKDPNWRSREANQSVLNDMSAVSKRCCYKEFAAEAEKCDICKKELSYAPGLIVHPRCTGLISQIIAAVKDKNGAEDKSIRHDELDAMLYLARYFQRSHATITPEQLEKRPWWLRDVKPKPKGPLVGDEEAARYWKGQKPQVWL